MKKTGRLVVADVGWKTCGVAAEIAALVAENAFEYLKAPIRRVALPDCPAPASARSGKGYYYRDACRDIVYRGTASDREKLTSWDRAYGL